MTAQHADPSHAPPRAPRPGAAAPPTGGTAAVPALPTPRGPLSRAVIDALAAGPPPDQHPGSAAGPDPHLDHTAPHPAPQQDHRPHRGAVLTALAACAAASADPYGDDVQLALHTCYELHYRGFDGVDDDWEWHPGLLRLRGALEETFLRALRRDVPGGSDVDGALAGLLTEPADARAADSVTHHLRDEGRWWQLLEHAALRSVYHLKEADPHAFVVPRLRGPAKTALVAVEHDEYGGGRPDMIHQGLYAGLLDDLGLDPSYGAYVDAAPAVMLATVNMMSLFGLRRSLRGAMVGHFAAAEITTAPAARRMAQAMERLGAGPRARLFYTEHIEADAVHEQVLRHDVIAPLLREEPELAPDVVLGVQATELLEGRLAAHLLGSWRARPPRSALRPPPCPSPYPTPHLPPGRAPHGAADAPAAGQ